MKVILGVLNGDGLNARYWDDNSKDVEVGEYAVVENLHGHDLVEVIGVGEIDDSKLPYVIGRCTKIKKVCYKIKKECIEEETK